jgi:predicted Fe-Mo cluster-binding NifX family protein
VFQTACDVENSSKNIKTFKKAREFLIKTVDKLNAKFVKVIDRDIATPAITHAGLEMLNDCISYIMDLMNL